MIREQFNYFDAMSTLSLSAQRPNLTGYPPLSALLVREVIASSVNFRFDDLMLWKDNVT